MQKFKYILDNLIGRCPSCYFNFLRIFCEMACSPTQDEFIWPLERMRIVRPSLEQRQTDDDEDDPGMRKDWALADYIDPDDEESERDTARKEVTKPVETVEVINKIRYYISEEQANDFINSCW